MGEPNGLAEAMARRVEGLSVLDGPSKKVTEAFGKAVGPGPLKDALSGTAIGHALHPMLTDVVIGAWLSSLLLDVTGGEDAEAGADRLLAAGLAAFGPTAVTGLSDYTDSVYGNDPVRRLGALHAAMNWTGFALQSGSLASRRAGARGRGKALSLAALGVMTAGGWLGGHLSYIKGIGVDQTAFDSGPGDWTPAGPAADVPTGEPISVQVGDTPVLLVRTAEGLRAVHDRCSHRGCSLAGGKVEGDVVQCPCHGSRFRLADGAIERGPATAPQPAYEVRERDGTVEIRLRA